MAELQKLQLLAERNPDLFSRITCRELVVKARREIAELVRASHDEIVLVPNATHGLNTILRNIEWREGDVLLGATTSYSAVASTLQYLADRTEHPRPELHIVQYTYPMSNADVIAAFHAKVREIKQAHPERHFVILPDDTAPKPGNRLVAVIDTISSMPSALLPWTTMVDICKEEGVWSVVDAAHSIGQELNIDLEQTGPDFWISNCHKWLYVKRGCAALYVPRRNQGIIKSSLPNSHGYVRPSETQDTRFVQQHVWTGTLDYTPYLTVQAALAFRKWLGGEERINTYCHKLAREGGRRVAEILGTRLLDERGQQTLSMVTVQLPLPVEDPASPLYTPELRSTILKQISDKLFGEWNTYPTHNFHAGGVWCRISAQVWNDISDFEYVAKALNEICKEIRDTILPNSHAS